MKKFTVPTREEVAPTNQAIFDNLKSKLGFVPNLYAAIAHSDTGLERYLAFQNAKTSLTGKEIQAVNLVVSEANECRYCQSAHTVLGKMNGFSEDEILKLRSGVSTNPKLNSLVTLAQEITETRGRVSEKKLDNFYKAGYTDANLVDLVLQISEKIAMNYLHNLTNIEIDFPVAQPLTETAVL